LALRLLCSCPLMCPAGRQPDPACVLNRGLSHTAWVHAMPHVAYVVQSGRDVAVIAAGMLGHGGVNGVRHAHATRAADLRRSFRHVHSRSSCGVWLPVSMRCSCACSFGMSSTMLTSRMVGCGSAMRHTTPRHRKDLAYYHAVCMLDCCCRSTQLLDNSPLQQRSDLPMLMLIVYSQWSTTAKCNTLLRSGDAQTTRKRHKQRGSA
jgi:hypothetical protein